MLFTVRARGYLGKENGWELTLTGCKDRCGDGEDEDGTEVREDELNQKWEW